MPPTKISCYTRNSCAPRRVANHFDANGGTMLHHDLLSVIKEGVENGRIAPHLAAYISAELLQVAAEETEYAEQAHLDGTACA